jgi:heptosyltransferase-2
MGKNKVLIIRFSSFGDIVQCSSCVEFFDRNLSNVEIDWVTRQEFKDLIKLNKKVHNVFALDRKLGIVGLIKIANQLRKEKYDYIYDAHNNLRSNLIYLIFKMSFSKSKWITRSKDRLKRILLFYFRINLFPKPFKGIDSYLLPLTSLEKNRFNEPKLVDYSFSKEIEKKIFNFIKPGKVITIVPSAAWPMKRWPLDHWKSLVEMSSKTNFYILGGKEDIFCDEIVQISPDRVINLAGKLSLIESCSFIKNSDLVISADTGLLHVADVLGVKGISLMGPSAFGFTKSELIKTLEVSLPCRPCSKDGSGKCSQSVWQKCMVDIKPTIVNELIQKSIE